MTQVETYRPTPAELDVLREKLAPDASDQDLHWLGAVARRLGLDPIAGHIVLIGRWDSRVGRNVYRPQVTGEGRLVVAERTGQLQGFDGPEWCGPRNESGGHDWLEVWDDDTPPHAARVFVHRQGFTRPINGTVRWAEFAQRDSKGRLTPTWQQMPAHMLGKVALSLGLRRAFPGLIPEDLGDDEPAPPAAEPEPEPAGPAPVDPHEQAVLRRRLARLTDGQRHQAREIAKARQLTPIARIGGAGDARPWHMLLGEIEQAARQAREEKGEPPPEPSGKWDPAAATPDQVYDDDLEHNRTEEGTERYDPEDMEPF